METHQVATAEDARAIIAEREPTHIKVGVVDMDGILRGKYMSRDKFLSSLDGGFGFCDVVLGWDANDQIYDNTTVTGWHTGFPDAPVRVLPATCRDIPFEPNTLFFLGEFTDYAEALCPRAVLRRVLAKAADMGFSVKAAFEYEFFVFEETPHSLREKNYRDLKPMAPGMFGYSMIRASAESDFYHALLETCEAMRLPIEGLHEETGPGVLEAALIVQEALEAADRAVLFKTFAKVVAQQHDLMATFMARWSTDLPGQSGHIHVSLLDQDGQAVFHDPSKPAGISDPMRHFIGGQQCLLPELTALVAPTVNSYRRLVPGFWAPTDASWGIDNRTVALRAISGGPKSQRMEYRVSGADNNPYLSLSAALASGLHGIENALEPTPPSNGNAYEATHPDHLKLPRSLGDAARRFRGSDTARSLFGDTFVDHFSASREWEEREFSRAVTDWEMARYFEII
ncbi:MAG: glutamine synthetase family protein [Alphaproteobacteria bacterium]